MSVLEARLEALLTEHKVPGASLAILDGDELIEEAAGVTNLRTAHPVTTDTLFQIGSISKIYTTTLLMQLVDAGAIELDKPVREYLPDFTLADEESAAAITVRMLVTHQSGIEGDHFDGFGRGDDCVEQYVASLAKLGQAHPLGTLWSYCNSAFVVAGLLLERHHGTSWDTLLRTQLVDALGYETTVTLPEEVLLHGSALGHIAVPPSADPAPAKAWHLTRAISPAGMISAPARDVIGFARMHLDGGQAASGATVLTRESVDAMQTMQVPMIPGSLATGWGLGWGLYDWGDARVLGHDGGTVGQLAFLRVVPSQHRAVCLLTNASPGGQSLARVLLREIFATWEIAVPSIPAPAAPGTVAIDPARYTGTYERLGFRTTITAGEGDVSLVADTEVTGALAQLGQPAVRNELRAIDDAQFIATNPDGGPEGLVAFVEPADDGRFGYWFAGRLARRIS